MCATLSTLAPDDVGKFLAAARKAPFPYYELFYTMLFTGLRRSEALALTWGSLDLNVCVLSVTQALHKVTGGGFVIRVPKTRMSRRQVDIPPSLALLLRDYRVKVEGQRLLLGTALKDSDFIFAHLDGSPLEPSTVTHTFGKVVRGVGIENLRLHDLRHSYASFMLAAGVNVKAISQSMGHSSISITLDTYAHLLPGAGRTAAERLDRLLEPMVSGAESVSKPLAKEGDLDSAPRGIRTHDSRFRRPVLLSAEL
jgi:integrase